MLVFPSGSDTGQRGAATCATAQVQGAPRARVGIINVMPQAEAYEPLLLAPLRDASVAVEPVWIRLESHRYSSSDAGRIRERYVTFEQALGQGLCGLILSGAPVEHLPFEQVLYWSELRQILVFARRHLPSTLGLCWGGLVLGHLLGLPKRSLPRKLFGVFPNRTLRSGHPLTRRFDDVFWCAQSRHSAIASEELEQAQRLGEVTLLAYGQESGYTLFESADGRFVAHLGHPEYEPARLVHEWERDRALGRDDVSAPCNFDPDEPTNVWRSHRTELFERWLARVARSEQLEAR